MIELTCGEWRSGPVKVADRFRDRLLGLRHAPSHGLLLAVRSVHSVGCRTALAVVGLDRDGRVLHTGILRPGRLVVWWDVAFILELPAGTRLPRVGSLLGVS